MTFYNYIFCIVLEPLLGPRRCLGLVTATRINRRSYSILPDFSSIMIHVLPRACFLVLCNQAPTVSCDLSVSNNPMPELLVVYLLLFTERLLRQLNSYRNGACFACQPTTLPPGRELNKPPMMKKLKLKINENDDDDVKLMRMRLIIILN